MEDRGVLEREGAQHARERESAEGEIAASAQVSAKETWAIIEGGGGGVTGGDAPSPVPPPPPHPHTNTHTQSTRRRRRLDKKRQQR
jgi:hypothetical protein